MNPALWGLLCAVSWGSADFIARFTGRALGLITALFGIFGFGVVVLGIVLWIRGTPLVWDPAGLGLVLMYGVGVMAATLFLYWGLARGPVTVVSPLVSTYPALNVAVAVLLGSRPTILQLAAMAAVMAGTIVVARAARSFEGTGNIARSHLRRTIVIALVASLCFAFAMAGAQYATPYYGELQTVWMGRVIGLVLCLGVFLVRRQGPNLPLRWWPLVGLQGFLDGLAYIALSAGSSVEGGEIAIVVGSGFGAFTVLLARIFLREAMTLPQWAGVVMIIGGVAVLSG